MRWRSNGNEAAQALIGYAALNQQPSSLCGTLALVTGIPPEQNAGSRMIVLACPLQSTSFVYTGAQLLPLILNGVPVNPGVSGAVVSASYSLPLCCQ